MEAEGRSAAVIYGWDLGGANIKAARLEHGAVRDVAQWACPLWQGLGHLEEALVRARERWPDCGRSRDVAHAVTMTGEMTDLFEHRQAGVVALAQVMSDNFGERVHFYAGEAGWRMQPQVESDWASIASANWLATASLAATRCPDAVLVDIGTTTTDMIPLAGGRVAAHGRDDAGRLASGELVYQGVVRTPLCALAPRIAFGGVLVNVMNEWFATTADVYRLTGELPALHDAHPSADGRAKTPEATRQRLARMIGRDAHEAPAADWLALAGQWRMAQIAELGHNLLRVLDAAGLPAEAPLVGAGCGHFLVRELAGRLGRRYRAFEDLVGISGAAAPWARVCAPGVAVAVLLERALRGVAAGEEALPCAG
ncbi:hydantoinase/oxoprolinase family protein [Cupriavidus necator]|uniref:hydantoinase/oxoprolinase family protein n=1 Tax=Cupriavidus necator TaxID=106590 RepID=UPI00339D4D93